MCHQGTRGIASFEGSSTMRGDLTSSTMRGDLTSSTMRGDLTSSTMRVGTISEASTRQNLTHFSSAGELRHHFIQSTNVLICPILPRSPNTGHHRLPPYHPPPPPHRKTNGGAGLVFEVWTSHSLFALLLNISWFRTDF